MDRTIAEGRTRVTAVEVLAHLRLIASEQYRVGMLRFGIPNENAVGIPVGTLRDLGKTLGRNHALAQSLWADGLYEARMLACFVADPAKTTPAMMDQWCKAFDSWAICDTACFHLFDRVPHAWKKVNAWAKRKPEFEKRAAFALLASLALHDKEATDEPFVDCLPLVEQAADDERNFVKKAVSWALRGIGGRSPILHTAAMELADRLAGSDDPTRRWIGKDVLRDLKRPLVAKRVAKRKS
jgi:3-methyladenine DNA glycosylase AlkD